ncbi:hypothetical protein [Roseiconus lacunae]|uniref:hypothetical protein n=1 Tax=Roseiconus lacunae TaxID=2605694 RepID=UPI001E57AC43|nr:hypothetical protein [Roseiconus lacunae]MCD0459572.1 hypothetical protein [Roseiconus lacunae]
MNKPSSPIPDDPKEYDTLAGCFETMAASLDLVAVVESTDEIRGSYLRKALELLAEAQSMLRSLVLHLDGPLDSEQNAAFHWLLRRAADANIFIDRHMKKEDPADPSRWHDLLGRVHDEDQRVRSVVEASRKRRKLFSKLDFKLKQLSETDQVQNQLVSVDSTINELIESGVPPSNVELRDMILPHRKVISRLDNKSKNLELILRESRRYSDRKAKLIKLPAATSPSSEVMDAAKLLKGKSIALIGGDCRNATKQSIEDTFELKELIWVETKHGQSYQSFRSIVEQPGVAVVLLAIRWASHSFSEVNRFCKENNTPLVRLPAGYSPSQIAAQVIAQCSETLDKQKMRKESKP